MTTKGQPGTIKIPTEDSEVIIDALDVIMIQRNGMNTTFSILDREPVISTKPFEHYLRVSEIFSFLCRCNEDTIINFYHVVSYKDPQGKVHKPGDPGFGL